MKTYVYILATLTLLSACNSDKKETTLPKDQLKKWKQEVVELNKKITSLEKSIQQNNPNHQAIPVITKQVTPELFQHFFEAHAIIEAKSQAYISPETGGQLKELFVTEGDQVKKGDALFNLNTAVIENSIAELNNALDLATIIFKKQERLWKRGIGSEVQYLEARNNKESLEKKYATLTAQLDMARIKSPLDGIVDHIGPKVGEIVAPGMMVMQIVNLNKIEAHAEVSENYLPVVHLHDTVTITFPTYPDLNLKAPITRTGNVINPENRSFKVEVDLNNREGKIKPNSMAVLHINDYKNPKALIVPSIIVKQDMQGSFIYITRKQENNLTAHKIYVTTGHSFRDQTQITAGLQSGDEIILKGFNQVSEGSYITIKN